MPVKATASFVLSAPSAKRASEAGSGVLPSITIGLRGEARGYRTEASRHNPTNANTPA
jgi:hypothetical protein